MRGVAQYNEFDLAEASIDYAHDQIKAGNLIRLRLIAGSFGYEEDEVRLAYAESLSAVAYMVETYGETGMKQLLAAYKEGASDETAFMAAFGRSTLDFEQDWLAWVGAPPDMYPKPTIQPTATWPPTPAMMMPPTSRPTDAPTLATPTVEGEEGETTAVVSPSSPALTATPTTSTPSGPETGARGWLWVLPLLFVAVLFVGGLVHFRTHA